MVKGQVISGEFGKICVRKKSDEEIELGELLIADCPNGKILMQVFDLIYGSQISQQNLELISGLKLEEENDLELQDKNLRNYTLALLKPLISISDGARLCKSLPGFFSEVREVNKDDLEFLSMPRNPLFLGKLRSGSKVMDVDINLDGEEVLSHHILIPGTTGRGKSVLLKVMLWNLIDKDYCGMLVLDPHDEYYGRNSLGLKDHKENDKVVYYTPKDVPSGCITLKVNLRLIKPQHFNGVADWSEAQREALYAYYKKFKEEWIKAIVAGEEIGNFQEGTVAVIKRRITQLLDLGYSDDDITCNGIFDNNAGESTIKEIVKELEEGKTVIIDTSNFEGAVEILIGSLIATEILNKYKYYKTTGELKNKPVINIVLEEAPRVLGKEVLEKGPNIFSTIAREGRKFKVGLTAITQLPSLIPRQVLANMNTKIILGIEMQPERQAVIESASQDLSEDNRNIASLDKGEAIITSNFARFATPIKIPLFEDLVKEKKDDFKKDFTGVKLS